MEKYTAGQATDDNMAHARCKLDTYGYKHTLRIHNTYYLTPATMVERTHLKVTFLHTLSVLLINSLIHPIIHFIGMCKMRRSLAVLRSFFHSSLLHTLSFQPSPLTSLSTSLTSSCHLFLGLPLSLVVSKFIYNTFLGIKFSSILCTCAKQRNLFNLIVSVIVGFLKIA